MYIYLITFSCSTIISNSKAVPLPSVVGDTLYVPIGIVLSFKLFIVPDSYNKLFFICNNSCTVNPKLL